MSADLAQRPIYRLRCDRDGCTAEFRAARPYEQGQASLTRWEASEAGWDVPAPRGKGSRRGTDFCPDHRGSAAPSIDTDLAIGTPVRYWRGVRDGQGVESRTRTRVQMLGGHTAVVWVEGYASCVALTHVEVIGEELLSTGDVARMWDVNKSTVAHWADKRLLAVARVTRGGHRRYRRTDAIAAGRKALGRRNAPDTRPPRRHVETVALDRRGAL